VYQKGLDVQPASDACVTYQCKFVATFEAIGFYYGRTHRPVTPLFFHLSQVVRLLAATSVAATRDN
jgi:hypothetical protein